MTSKTTKYRATFADGTTIETRSKRAIAAAFQVVDENGEIKFNGFSRDAVTARKTADSNIAQTVSVPGTVQYNMRRGGPRWYAQQEQNARRMGYKDLTAWNDAMMAVRNARKEAWRIEVVSIEAC